MKRTELSCVEIVKPRWASISVLESIILVAYLVSVAIPSTNGVLTSNHDVSWTGSYGDQHVQEGFRYNMSYRLESSTIVRNARALVSSEFGKLE